MILNRNCLFFEDNALLFTHNKILQSDKNRIIPKSAIDKANIATFTTKILKQAHLFIKS